MRIHFDDLIYRLQRFGGASVYWRQVTARVARDPRFSVRHGGASRALRGVPAFTRADVFHSSHFRTAIPGLTKTVATVHDLNYELGYVKADFGTTLNILERRLSYFTADALICISENTRQELLQVYPQLRARCPIHVVHHGIESLAVAKPAFDPPQRFGRYILYVGARRGYKRFSDALDGFRCSELRRVGLKLLCTGSEFDPDEREEIVRQGLAEEVVVAGVVDDATLAALYAGAHCLVYSSTREGFGLPLLEAMDNGCPVVACRTSCMPEIVGDAALLVRPQSPEDISAAILALLDPGLRASLIAKGRERVKSFSWERSAQEHMNIYLATAASSRP